MRKKKVRLRGKRTHGKGDTKRRRGKGSKGGKGRAGSQGQKKMLFLGSFGKLGFKGKKKRERIINLDILSQKLDAWIKKEKTGKKSGLYIIDGKKIGFDKILGKGNINEKIRVVNMKVSKKAKQKIERAGGSIEER